ncbi:glucose 1-dehydrogenase [Bradyrhizobium sp. LB11.1]|uniref:SDR family NAD(P)-dependent oxidoreductase n=1 Tax=Bradyrhizobium sp. LB11.1 TaxID=3156326 RepID=UPI00339463D2
MKLKGQCAIVTGAATGIGFAAAKRLAEEGASVVIADIKGHEAAATDLTAKGLDVVAVTADVSRDDSVSGLVKSTMERCGRIDIVVNNAAMASQLKPGPFEQKTAEDWLRVYDVNVVGIFRMCRAVSPHMRAAGSGRIINLSSGTAFKGTPGLMQYVASKGAIISMTRALASEFAPDNILVNAVAPGFTLSENAAAKPELRPYSEMAIATRLIKRDAYPIDLANVIYFLASPDAGFITGQVIAVDGGSVFH